MKTKIRNTKSLLMMTTFLAILSCSHRPQVQSFPSSASPREETLKLSSRIANAKADQIDVLSPKSFKESEKALKNAQEGLSERDSSKEILEDVALGQAYLDQSFKTAHLAKSNLNEVMIARKSALNAHARDKFKIDFQKADNDLIDVTEDLENNETKSAIENKNQLQLVYLELELRAIKHNKLSLSKGVIEKARDEGALEFAPRTLSVAEKSYQETDAFITANRHNDNLINLKAVQTKKAADHALRITRQAKSGEKVSSEDMALKMEADENKLVNTRNQLAINKGALVQGENTIANLQENRSTLESEKEFNMLYEDARNQFDSSEAEVYKKGDVLVLRLRSLKFSSARSSLEKNSYPLLSKVNNVIKSFGDSKIIIEGHTDSVGGIQLNQKLSLDRANAVRDYFLANFNYQPDAIEAIGFGYEKPLATNKTAQGRAQNRRVDIFVHPVIKMDTASNN